MITTREVIPPLSTHITASITMAKNGLAKGANKGYITETRERAARPSSSRGVSQM